MSTGMLMFYGGIGGGVFFLLWLILTLATAGRKRRRLIDRIQKSL